MTAVVPSTEVETRPIEITAAMNKRTLIVTAVVVGLGLAFAAGSWFGGRTGPATRATAGTATLYTCPMHPSYRADRPGDCPLCGMRLVPVAAGGTGSSADPPLSAQPGVVRVDADKQQVIGVRIDEVPPASAAHLTLRVPGRVAVDEQRSYRLIAAVDGWVRTLGPNPPGSFVRKDEVLATYYAQNLIGSAQTLVFAVQTNQQANTGDATVGYQRQPTQLSLQVAIDSLRALGMSEKQIQELQQTHVAPAEIRVYSPADGFVIARGLSPEQRFDKGMELYRISDIRHVWVLAQVLEKDRDFLKPGTRAAVLYHGRRLEARMSDSLPQFDAETRTLETRFELDNPDNVLRPDMFVDVEIEADMPVAVTVPADAIVDSGLSKTVFVDRGHGYFEPRRVETGWRVGDRVQVTRGLMPGERIVISGTFLIDSESRMKTAAMAMAGPVTKDPVCGMDVDQQQASTAGRTADYQGKPYFFCSEDCKHQFETSPGRYVHK